jgi:hypothetical protein
MISVPKAIHESIIHLHGVARIVSIQINLEIQNSNLRDPSEMVFGDQQDFSQFLAGRFTALVKFQNASLERSHRMKSMEKTTSFPLIVAPLKWNMKAKHAPHPLAPTSVFGNQCVHNCKRHSQCGK